MASLTHKTTILLSPQEHQALLREAAKCRKTMGEMIRQAIHRFYIKTPAKKGRKDWDRLFRAKAPVSDWEKMEREILKGRLDS